MPLLRDVPPGGTSEVGLSFDDGPTPETTPELIDLLRRHNATASFFLTGERAAQAPHLVAALVAAGHDVFAHGWRHVACVDEPEYVLHGEMARTEALLSRFRPTPEPYLVCLPYVSGRRSARMHHAIRAWQPTAQLAFWRFGFEDHRLAEGCSSETGLQQRCAAAAAPVLAHRRLPSAILLLHEQPTAQTRLKGLSRNDRVSVVGRLGFRVVLSLLGDRHRCHQKSGSVRGCGGNWWWDWMAIGSAVQGGVARHQP
jgi:peptidoglycan/xylan/chitin deacetylase (PgdA/CDA1 family)